MKCYLRSKIRQIRATDVNVFNQHQMNVVDIGIGYQRAHTVNETIKLSDMVRLVRVLVELVKV